MFVRATIVAFPGNCAAVAMSWCTSPSPRWRSVQYGIGTARQHQAVPAQPSIGARAALVVELPTSPPPTASRRAGLHGDLSGHDARHWRSSCRCGARAGWSAISDLAGLARTNPAMAFFLAMLLFSLAAGIPLAGSFFPVLHIIPSAIGLFVLAVIGVVTSVVGAYYYLTIVKIMYFDRPAACRCPTSSKDRSGRQRMTVHSSVSRAAGRSRDLAANRLVDRNLELDAGAGSEPRSAGVRQRWMNSTNAEALRLMRQGERADLWIAAERQSAGRGWRWTQLDFDSRQSARQPLADGPGPAEHWPRWSWRRLRFVVVSVPRKSGRCSS